MGKSDLIEKINARVKSQMSSLTARTAVKARADEKDERAADLGEKRITSRAGTVVVRRRGAQQNIESQEMGPAGATDGLQEPMEGIGSAHEIGGDFEPIAHPLEMALEAIPEPITHAEPEVSRPEASEASAREVRRPEGEQRRPEPSASVPVAVAESAPPVVSMVQEAADGHRPTGRERVSGREAPPAIEPSVVAAVEHNAAATPVSAPPVAPIEHKSQAEQDRGTHGAVRSSPLPSSRPTPPSSAERGRPGTAPAQPVRTPPSSTGRPRSIEDVLAQERGRVPVQHRAMVVGEVRRAAPVQRVERPAGERMDGPHRSGERTDRSSGPEVMTRGIQGSAGRGVERQPQQGGQSTNSGSPGGGSSQPGGNVRRPVNPSPTAVKEIANDDRKKDKPIVKGAPVRAGGTRTLAEEEADRLNKGVKAKKTLKKKEVLQRRDVTTTAESEPQFRKHRRMAPKREKAKTKITTPKAIKRVIRIEDSISVGELAHRMGIKAPAVIKKLIPLGVMATINQAIDHDTASLVAADFGYEVENVAFDETVLLADVLDRREDLVRRPPVVTIMGHVDHGKTTLLDAIRHTDVASKEAGGITQHIGAYTVETESGKIVFLDTPGHEAFTAMRARGAQVTDIVVLVVAADDGVMPQTVEALNHAKAAKVPIIVAINKIDKPGADAQRVRQKLTEYELVPEEWGGQTIVAEVSAKSKLNIREMLELILLQAEVLELQANPNRPARATVVESQLDKGRGPVATVLVNNGTLRVGDVVVVGAQYGKVRAMVDDKGKSVKEAGPSIPVEILGLSGVPEAGDTLAVVDELETAKSIAENRSEKAREQGMARSAKVSLEDLFNQLQKSEMKELKLVLKTDVQGSLEALNKAITELSTTAVKTTILHAGVGAISEGDVMLASASGAIILGFNAKPDAKSSALAEQEGVQINSYSVIYDAMDDLRKAMQGLLKPIMRERVIGHAEVRETFSIPKIGLVAGTSVTDGKISRGAMVRLQRGGKVMWEGRLASLRRFKDDVREVEKGYECGIGLEGYNDVRLGDVIEAYVIDEIRPSL